MSSALAVGIDVGGTKIAGAVFDLGALATGTAVPIRQHRQPTPVAAGPAAVLDAIAATVRLLLADLPRRRVRGVGVGTGGVIDASRGVVLSATDVLPGWAGTELAGDLAERCGLPVRADGDGNTTLLGEHAAGAARGVRSVLSVAVGTGIGGGLMLNGALVRGAHHAAGHLGHVPAPGSAAGSEVLCSCGAHGHVEALASGPAMTRRYRAVSGQSVESLHQVAARLDVDPLAARVVAEGGRTLGATLAGLANAFDPELVVVGGGVSEMGTPFLGPLRDGLRAGLLPALADLAVVPAELGGRASVLGAATLVAEEGP